MQRLLDDGEEPFGPLCDLIGVGEERAYDRDGIGARFEYLQSVLVADASNGDEGKSPMASRTLRRPSKPTTGSELLFEDVVKIGPIAK